jgi:hypothetical protein
MNVKMILLIVGGVAVGVLIQGYMTQKNSNTNGGTSGDQAIP